MSRDPAVEAWCADDEEGDSPSGVWWDSYKDAWCDGYETGIKAQDPTIDHETFRRYADWALFSYFTQRHHDWWRRLAELRYGKEAPTFDRLQDAYKASSGRLTEGAESDH